MRGWNEGKKLDDSGLVSQKELFHLQQETGDLVPQPSCSTLPLGFTGKSAAFFDQSEASLIHVISLSLVSLSLVPLAGYSVRALNWTNEMSKRRR